MADDVEAWCAKVCLAPTKAYSLVLAGPSGTGKTHCLDGAFRFAQRAAFDLWERGVWLKKLDEGGVTVERLTWSEVVMDMEFRREASLGTACGADVLFLDDVGAEHDPWKRGSSLLCHVLDKRSRKFTLLTTNATPDEWPERFESRVADRLNRGSVVVDLAGVESWATL